MRDIKTLIKILINAIEKDKRRVCMCSYTTALFWKCQREEDLVDAFLFNEMKFNIYDGFESCLTNSVNNHTGCVSSYFFEKGNLEIRLKWLRAVIEKIDSGKLCPESMVIIEQYTGK